MKEHRTASMRQVVQNFKSGDLSVDDVPVPALLEGAVLVANEFSLISAGTERSTVDLARKNLIGKAQARPDLVRKVVEKLSRDGIVDTVRMVTQRLDRSAALGYSCAGVVVGVGSKVQGFAPGDRVACAGQDYASHAELVCIPANLCVHVPASVGLADAAFVAVGAIALQGVRQCEPRIGETIAVIGLGLVGQLIAQILTANGCRVVAADVDAQRVALALRLGAHQAVAPDGLDAVCAQSAAGRGVDAVIIAASTPSNEPIERAAGICRQKGRVVVVGAVGMNLPREPFYRKELELRLSTSYGPGRYDAAYEQQGIDYPYGYVRWTEGRNLAAFLQLIADGRIDVAALASHRFTIGDAASAYELLRTGAPSLGILLAYPDAAVERLRRPRVQLHESIHTDRVRIGIIGPGNHVRDRRLPHLRTRRDIELRAVCAATGISAKAVANREKAAYCTADYREILADTTIDAVLVGTRHDSHAQIVTAALAQGKHVFVEKPLCLTEEELDAIDHAYGEAAALRHTVLAVGFNRRHSPHVRQVAEWFEGRVDPLTMIYRVNALAIAGDHWIQDPAIGGGRIIGEACHFIDVLHALAGAAPVRVHATRVGRHSSGIIDDKAIITLDFADGSIGTVIYTGDGDRSVPKERLEVYGAGRSAILDDFRVTTLHGGGKQRSFKTRTQDKGFVAELDAFLTLLESGASGDAVFAAARLSMLATLKAQRSLALREPLTIG
jgi:predicted dehydrogenase